MTDAGPPDEEYRRYLESLAADDDEANDDVPAGGGSRGRHPRPELRKPTGASGRAPNRPPTPGPAQAAGPGTPLPGAGKGTSAGGPASRIPGARKIPGRQAAARAGRVGAQVAQDGAAGTARNVAQDYAAAAAKQAAKRAVKKVATQAATKAGGAVAVKIGLPVIGIVLAMLLLVILASATLNVLSQGKAAADCIADGSFAPPGAETLADIPGNYLLAYQRAAATVPGMHWAFLAAIGKKETDHGRYLFPADQHLTGTRTLVARAGQSVLQPNTYNAAGAAGPMQFGAYAGSAAGNTWGAYGRDGDGDGLKTVWNIDDAAFGAAAYTSANGAPANLQTALFAYNRAQWYVDAVLAIYEAYLADAQNPVTPTAVPLPSGPSVVLLPGLPPPNPFVSPSAGPDLLNPIASPALAEQVLLDACNSASIGGTGVAGIPGEFQIASAAVACAVGGPGTVVNAPGGVGATPIRLCSVNGTLANALAAKNYYLMVQAAAADGIMFGGGSYRSRQSQIDLRVQNCGGNTYYSIYEKPSSRCSPPTAKPSNSNHEWGLAFDLTVDGQILKTSRGAAHVNAFNWLKANAGTYGLYNLPSENWHWSVDAT